MSSINRFFSWFSETYNDILYYLLFLTTGNNGFVNDYPKLEFMKRYDFEDFDDDVFLIEPNEDIF